MKTVCIYHANCFDGICSAWVISKVFPDAEFRAFNYDMEFPFHEYGKNDNIIIVDFSFKRDVMIAIKEQINSLIVLDHHKTAQAACEGLDFCIFDMNESGASLAWKHFFPNINVPFLVRYIKDRDLWLYKEAKSEEINSYIQSFPMTIKCYNDLYEQLEEENGYGFHDAEAGGAAILRYKKTMIEAMCRNATIGNARIFNENIPIANASMLFSEVGNELCKMYPQFPFAAYYFDRLYDNMRQWGLRSIGNYDVSEVAKQFGGGGHKNAAGFTQSLSEL